MHIILSFLFIISNLFVYAQFSSYNMSMYSRWYDANLEAEPNLNIKYNSVWGYYYPLLNKEYAILGGTDGTYIIDVTDPVYPILKDYVPGRRNKCIWREYKTYQNYLYAVSDDSQPNSLQIIDLSYLPDSVHVIHDSDSIFARSHTIFIDGNKLYAGSVTLANGTFYSMAVYNLVNPGAPQFLRALNQDYPAIGHVHDMFVRNDTIYASCGYDGFHVYIFNGTNFVEIGSLTSYPDMGYNHSSWLTDDGKTMVFTDEVPADLAVKVIDVSDISDIQVTATFKSNPGATAHNPYIKGNSHVIIAYYQDGVQIYNIEDPSNPVRTGYFDTYPQNTSGYLNPVYAGNWGAYPYLPSGIILASDMQNGLFILNGNAALVGEKEISDNAVNISIYPNPAKNFIVVSTIGIEEYQLQIVDINGKIVVETSTEISHQSIDVSNLSKGIYFVKVKSNEKSFVQKLIKH
ncbi:MAG: choice-of-anchor B family protein [Bacteroidia bacterium]